MAYSDGTAASVLQQRWRALEFRRGSRLSIVMIELDQSATGKTVDLPNRQPHLSKLDFDLFHNGRGSGYLSVLPRVSSC